MLNTQAYLLFSISRYCKRKRGTPVQQKQEASIEISVSFLEVVDTSEGCGTSLANHWFQVN